MSKSDVKAKAILILLLLILTAVAASQDSSAQQGSYDQAKRMNLQSNVKSTNTGEKSFIVTAKNSSTSNLFSFKFSQGDYIIGNYQIFSNETLAFGDITYKMKLQYKLYGYDEATLRSSSRETLRNGSDVQILASLDLVIDDPVNVYVVAQAISGINEPSELDIKFEFKIVDTPKKVSLDQTKEYQILISAFNDDRTVEKTVLKQEIDDIYLFLPESMRAKNETELPENYNYIFHLVTRMQIEQVTSEQTRTDIKQRIDGKASDNYRYIEDGPVEFKVENITYDEPIKELIIEHSGDTINVDITEVVLHVPALINVPVELITPQWIKISAPMVAAILGLSSYKIVSIFGRKKIVNYKEQEM